MKKTEAILNSMWRLLWAEHSVPPKATCWVFIAKVVALIGRASGREEVRGQALRTELST